jgi:hypothetical protein
LLLSFDFRGDLGLIEDPSDAYLTGAQLLCSIRDTQGNVTYRGASLAFRPSGGVYGARFRLDQDPPSATPITTLMTQTQQQSSVHYRLEAVRSASGLTATLTVNGSQEVITHTVRDCVGEWVIHVGLHGRGVNASAWFDNMATTIR